MATFNFNEMSAYEIFRLLDNASEVKRKPFGGVRLFHSIEYLSRVFEFEVPTNRREIVLLKDGTIASPVYGTNPEGSLAFEVIERRTAHVEWGTPRELSILNSTNPDLRKQYALNKGTHIVSSCEAIEWQNRWYIVSNHEYFTEHSSNHVYAILYEGEHPLRIVKTDHGSVSRHAIGYFEVAIKSL